MTQSPAKLHRILLVEDDPVSREFLTDAMSALPAEVKACESGSAALPLLNEGHFDLLVLDRHLQDTSAAALLTKIRALPSAAATIPALAVSAEVSDTLRTQLLSSGFLDLLAKPIAAAELRQSVRRHLPDDRMVWDEQQALAATNGNPDIVDRLRALLRHDLPQQRDAIASAIASGNAPEAQAVLHRLKAACAFCGATRLADATSALDEHLRADALDGLSRNASLQEFIAACGHVLETSQT